MRLKLDICDDPRFSIIVHLFCVFLSVWIARIRVEWCNDTYGSWTVCGDVLLPGRRFGMAQ